MFFHKRKSELPGCSTESSATGESDEEPAGSSPRSKSRGPTAADSAHSAREPNIYNRLFWWAYIANVMLVSGNALTFRFAELVNLLGGTQQLAGTIVSAGTVGALFGRLFLGQFIDRYGVRPLWLFCSLMYIVGIGLTIGVPSLGLSMYLGRLLFAFGLGGMFACSMTHIQNQVPAHRRTEMIATLGSSGFLGMMTGSQLGDLILVFTPDTMLRYLWLFGCSGAFGLLYLLIVLWLTRHETHRAAGRQIPAWPLLVKYWPGWVMLVAMMMGMGFAGSTVFLTRYATSLGLRGVGTYFTAYALSAFVIRMLTRHTSRLYGRHVMIVVGMLGHVAGYAGLCLVTQEWHFILPAACSGFAHALLFPCVVSLGTETFPQRFRGTGTTLLLCMIDLGGVLTAPLLGAMIDHLGFKAMFLFTATCALGVAITYRLATARQVDPETLPQSYPTRRESLVTTNPGNSPDEVPVLLAENAADLDPPSPETDSTPESASPLQEWEPCQADAAHR